MSNSRMRITDSFATLALATRKQRQSRRGTSHLDFSPRTSRAELEPAKIYSLPSQTQQKSMDERTLDILAIKEVIENWAVWRDSGDWERFRTVWHDDGYMMATWFQGTAEEFIRVNQEGWNRGGSILHLLGGTSVELAGNRAIAQTKMTISQRALVHDVMVDVLCT